MTPHLLTTTILVLVGCGIGAIIGGLIGGCIGLCCGFWRSESTEETLLLNTALRSEANTENNNLPYISETLVLDVDKNQPNVTSSNATGIILEARYDKLMDEDSLLTKTERTELEQKCMCVITYHVMVGDHFPCSLILEGKDASHNISEIAARRLVGGADPFARSEVVGYERNPQLYQEICESIEKLEKKYEQSPARCKTSFFQENTRDEDPVRLELIIHNYSYILADGRGAVNT